MVPDPPTGDEIGAMAHRVIMRGLRIGKSTRREGILQKKPRAGPKSLRTKFLRGDGLNIRVLAEKTREGAKRKSHTSAGGIDALGGETSTSKLPFRAKRVQLAR